MKRLLATVLFAVALQGCVTGAEFTGTGPVKLSDRQQTAFDDWARGTTDRDSLYFFLVRGGGVYRVFCPATRALCKDSTEFASHQQCERRYGKGSCKMYGVYGDVVWQSDRPADMTWWNVNRGFHPTKSQAAEGVDVRSIRIRWGGHSGEINGALHYRKSQRRYDISVVIPQVTYCDGSAEFTRKTWTMSCRNNVTARGTFEPLGEGKGSVGVGQDTKGNQIEFQVGPAKP